MNAQFLPREIIIGPGDQTHAPAYWCNLAANHFRRKTTAFRSVSARRAWTVAAVSPTTPLSGRRPIQLARQLAMTGRRVSDSVTNPGSEPVTVYEASLARRRKASSAVAPVGILGFAGRGGDWPDPAAAGAIETVGALNQGFGPDVFSLLFIISVGRLQSPAETAGAEREAEPNLWGPES